MSISCYKQRLRELKIRDRQVAEYIGHTRETVTLWLNGRQMPKKCEEHIIAEIEELIIQKKFKLLLGN